MCDRQAQLSLWRAGYQAGAAQQAALDRQAMLDSGRAYQAFMMQQLIGLLDELLDGHVCRQPTIPETRSGK